MEIHRRHSLQPQIYIVFAVLLSVIIVANVIFLITALQKTAVSDENTVFVEETQVDDVDSDKKTPETDNQSSAINQDSDSESSITNQNPGDESSTSSTGETSVSTPTPPISNASKIVYLTFDDGPGAYTAKLLDVLKKYGAKATFFVTCAGDDALIKREFDEGHAVGLHTCSHVYSQVYASDAAYFKDLAAVSDRVKKITGVESKLIRFPGGSSNAVSAKYSKGIMTRLVKEVANRGYAYFDWNVSSGDAGGTVATSTVYNNVINGMGKFVNGAIVLQHDIKSFSVDAVEQILQYGQSHGFVFEKLTIASYAAHHGVNN